MNLPKISIITPTFNSSKTLEDCLESVANQNYFNLEHWIIDGISSDNTIEIVEKYSAQYPHIKYISEKDNGIYDAMNKGILKSDGEWLFFLGSDDVLAGNILNDIFKNNYNVVDKVFIYGKVESVEEGLIIGEYFDKNLIITRPVWISHQGAFFNKILFDKIGLYDLNYKIMSDAHFMTKVFSFYDYQNILFIDKIFSKITLQGFSNNSIDNIYFKNYPAFIKEYYHKDLDLKEFQRYLSKHDFIQIYKGSLKKGIQSIIKKIINNGDIYYYCTNTFYWLKRRLYNFFR